MGRNFQNAEFDLKVLLDCLFVCFKAHYIGKWRLIQEGSHFTLKMRKVVKVLKFRSSFSNLANYCPIHRKVCYSSFKLYINHCCLLHIFSQVEPILRLFLPLNYNIHKIKSSGNLKKSE